MKPIVAAFDFDGTLSAGVSGLRFFRQLLGGPGYAWFFVRCFPELVSYGRRIRHEASLDRINRHVFAGRRASEVELAAEFFWKHTLPQSLLSEPMRRLHAHVARGERCIIVSRGYEAYLRPWAQSVGVTDVIATRLTVGTDGRLTGEMPDASCDGALKCERLNRLLGDRAAYEVHAYGDGPGDFAMLASADRAFIREGCGFRTWRLKR